MIANRIVPAVIAGLISVLLSGAALAGAAPIPVMLLDGESAGTYHDWKAITPVLKKELEETELFRVDVVTAPASNSGGLDSFHPDFSKYQVVVLNYDAPDWPAPLKASFEKYMKEGGGLVSVHAADNAFPGWKAFNEMIGIGGWRSRNETAGPLWFLRNGKLVSDSSPGPAGSHGARLPFQVTARLGSIRFSTDCHRSGCTRVTSCTRRSAGLARTCTCSRRRIRIPPTKGPGAMSPSL